MGSILNVFKVPELRKRILYTLGMLAVYRIGVFVTAPGVDRELMREYVNQGGSTGGGGLLGMFNFFSGGALENFSVLALGIMPYITSSIIMQVMAAVVPALERLQKEGGKGREKINQYTRYGTMLIATVQAILLSKYVMGITVKGSSVVNPEWAASFGGYGFTLLIVVTLCTGTAFLMWLGERITERGVGNGISLIITAGIIAGLPGAIVTTVQGFNEGLYQAHELAILAVMMLLVIFAIVFVERGLRKIPVHYAKRMIEGKQYGGDSAPMPLKVNTAGVIPPIFASSMLMFPATAASVVDHPWMLAVRDALLPGSWIYLVVFVAMIIFFAFFYTSMTINPVEMADNLKKFGGFVPGIRPGRETAEYIDYVLTRITTAGSVYLAAVCVMPMVIQEFMSNQVPFYFGGTGLLIAVGVALDTVSQIEGYLIEHNYEGFSGESGVRVRGRARNGAPPIIG